MGGQDAVMRDRKKPAMDEKFMDNEKLAAA